MIKMKNILLEKKEFDEKFIRKAMKMKPTEVRIFLSHMIGNRQLKAAYEGVKAIEKFLGYVLKKRDLVNILDMSLKMGLDKKYSNYKEIIGNLDL
tara:strand:+ start:252 stop:536 length:285 start_codon:yes stop_codon:yes gene_type:complete